MSGVRRLVFSNGDIYHIFNRGVERRPIFTQKREYSRCMQTIDYYRHVDPSPKFSKYLELSLEKRNLIPRTKIQEVDIYSLTLMPNHFHLCLKQLRDNGISRFVSNFCNSYSRYFNIKAQRVGPLFQGPFKAVYVETQEQLVHLTRYIHINPTTSNLVKEADLDGYPWSSFPFYLADSDNLLINTKPILDIFGSRESYRKFVHDQIDYAKKLKEIEHLLLE